MMLLYLHDSLAEACRNGEDTNEAHEKWLDTMNTAWWIWFLEQYSANVLFQYHKSPGVKRHGKRRISYQENSSTAVGVDQAQNIRHQKTILKLFLRYCLGIPNPRKWEDVGHDVKKQNSPTVPHKQYNYQSRKICQPAKNGFECCLNVTMVVKVNFIFWWQK